MAQRVLAKGPVEWFAIQTNINMIAKQPLAKE